MIKKFNEFINEDFTDLYKRWKNKEVRKEDSLEVKMKDFISTKKNSEEYYIENGKVCCKGDVVIDDNDLIDGKFPFKFGKVEGNFCCAGCEKLISLEGAPEKVEGHFNGDSCCNLKSLKGVPEKVGGDFICDSCYELTSLEGSPKEVGGDFSCCEVGEKLESLEGAPEKVKGDFACCYCEKLTSLEGSPKEVGGDFYCIMCGKEFTKSDLPKGTIIKGNFKDSWEL